MLLIVSKNGKKILYRKRVKSLLDTKKEDLDISKETNYKSINVTFKRGLTITNALDVTSLLDFEHLIKTLTVDIY